MVVVVDRTLRIERHQRDLRLGNRDRTVAVNIERPKRTVAHGVAAHLPGIITQTAVERQLAAIPAQLRVRCIGIVVELVASAAAVAEERGTIGNQAGIGHQRILKIPNVDQRGVVALGFEQIRRPGPVDVDRLA